MEVIKKNNLDWINLFSSIDKIRLSSGRKIFDDTIKWLSNVKKGKVLKLDEISLLLNILAKYDINDIDLMIRFLNKIKAIYDFKNIINNINLYEKMYGIKEITFILGDDKFNKINTVFSNVYLKRCFVSRNVILMSRFDFKRGQINLLVDNRYDFIIDEKDFRDNYDNRVLYTTGFYFNSLTMPSKEEMDLIVLDDLRSKWLDQLLFSIKKFTGQISLDYLDNKSFRLEQLDDNLGYIVFSDGLLLDCYGNEIGYNSLKTDDFVVKHALVLLVGKVFDDNIVDFRLIINPLYFKKYWEEKKDKQEIDYLQIILSLLDDVNLEGKYGISK